MTNPKSHLEIEQKYDAAPDFAVPDLTGLPGVAAVSEPVRQVLVATYFDTDDYRLAASSITLRRRRGGEDSGWHLKVPAGPDSKNELRAPLGRANIVPVRLSSLVAGRTRGAELRPVARLETTRTVMRLLDEHGAALAEIADDAVTGEVAGVVIDDPAVRAWREIEVELVDGGPELLKAVGKRLYKAGARRAGSSSKLGRLLEGAGATPKKGDAVAVTEPGSAGEAVVGYLATHVTAVLSYDPKARLAEFDAVHKMRVSVRRIRSVLRSYAAVLDREQTDVLQPELKWLADVLGEVRDLEVLRMRFTGWLTELSEQHELGEAVQSPQSWVGALADAEAAAYRRMNISLRQPRYYELLNALDTLVADPPLTERATRRADKELPRLVTKSWRRLERNYDSITTAEDPDIARHDTRKAGKRARYAADLAAEALEGANAKAAAQVASDAKSLQEVLGGFQDGVIAMEHLRGAATQRTTTTSEAFVIGVLYGLERRDADATLSHLEETWSQLKGPRF